MMQVNGSVWFSLTLEIKLSNKYHSQRQSCENPYRFILKLFIFINCVHPSSSMRGCFSRFGIILLMYHKAKDFSNDPSKNRISYFYPCSFPKIVPSKSLITHKTSACLQQIFHPLLGNKTKGDQWKGKARQSSISNYCGSPTNKDPDHSGENSGIIILPIPYFGVITAQRGSLVVGAHYRRVPFQQPGKPVAAIFAVLPVYEVPPNNSRGFRISKEIYN